MSAVRSPVVLGELGCPPTCARKLSIPSSGEMAMPGLGGIRGIRLVIPAVRFEIYVTFSILYRSSHFNDDLYVVAQVRANRLWLATTWRFSEQYRGQDG